MTGATLQEVADAARVIGGLEPRPGRGFGGEDPVYITPDIYVYKIGDDFHVLLNEDGLPKLKINSMYREVLSSAGSKGAESAPPAELAEKEEAEIAVLEGYLPQQLDEAATAALIDEAIASTGASGKADMGKGLVMGISMALIAMAADRVIQAWAGRRKEALGLT